MPITRNKRKRKIRSIRKTRGRKIKRNYRKLSRKNKKSKKSRRKKMKKKTKTKKRNRRGKGLIDDFLKSFMKKRYNRVEPQLHAPKMVAEEEEEGVAEDECKFCLKSLDTKKEKNLVQFECKNNCIFHKECLNKWCKIVYEMREEESLKQCPSCASKIDYKCPNNNNNNSSRPRIQRMNAFSEDDHDQQYYNLMYHRIDAHDE